MILYKKTKSGKVQIWSITHKGGELEIQHGQLNGKMQQSYKICKPKNVGKKNETTAEVQAEREMASMILKQKDKGYYESLDDCNTETKIAPMLAHKLEDYEHKVTYPCCVQPKLDGVRCLYHSGKLWSRRGKEYKAEHILQELELLNIPSDIVLDGEIYVHDIGLQEINSLVKKYKEESKVLQYHIYDIYFPGIPNMVYSLRQKYLERFKDTKSIKFVVSSVANTKEEVTQHYNFYIQNGFEGAMLRSLDYKYELGHRSHGLLKIKSFQDEEFEIVGFKNGSGKFKDCVIFQCKTEDSTFDVVPKGTFKEKAKMLEDAPNNIGKMLKVQFFDKTNDNIPRFPVGLCIRLEDD